MCVCVCVYIYIYIYIYIYVYIYIYIYIYICVNIYVCMYIYRRSRRQWSGNPETAYVGVTAWAWCSLSAEFVERLTMLQNIYIRVYIHGYIHVCVCIDI